MSGSNEEEDYQFFDSREDLSDLGSDGSEDFRSNSHLSGCAFCSSQYDLWIREPDSVQERRSKLLRWMGISSGKEPIGECEDMSCDKFEMHIARITKGSGAVLRSSILEDGSSSTESFASIKSNSAFVQLDNTNVEENSVHEATVSNDGTDFTAGEVSRNSTPSRIREWVSSPSIAIGKFQSQGSLSPFVQRLLGGDGGASTLSVMRNKLKQGWLRRLGAITCIASGQGELGVSDNDLDQSNSLQRKILSVYPQKKKSKELSSLYADQEFLAHGGSISTMKFSPDGQHLATAGEDGTVRVWKVIEVERSNKFDISEMDPSSLYFSVNHHSELSPLDADKEKFSKVKKLTKSSDLTCVIFPPKVFHLLEKPLHEFHGHNGEILDLSWSRKGYLLSSSIDKTVRLWQVGCEQCLRVFLHNNYVTSVQFNPMDDNYFISGSIDGKVRIWEVLRCQVVDWTDIREIVTAVGYRPDGKGGIVGTVTGNCHFYDIAENELQLDTQMSLQGKNRLPSTKITGFQFCPSDPSKVMITSADSKVRILCGLDIACKLKGLRYAGSQTSASFTADGRHVVSAGEDSNVYIWNYTSEDSKTSFRAKSNKSSETFLSRNAAIAVPWCGVDTMPRPPFLLSSDLLLRTNRLVDGRKLHDESSLQQRALSSSNTISLSPGFLLEPSPKGSATWPEETLRSPSPAASPAADIPRTPKLWRSGYKFLKTACHNLSSSSHMWGMVIVTAGWDGRIRTFHNYGLPLHL